MWALGILAYELCCGDVPWRSSNKDKVKQEISDVSPLYIFIKVAIDFPTHFSPSLRNFITSLTMKHPKDRPNARQALAHEFLKVNAMPVDPELIQLIDKLIKE